VSGNDSEIVDELSRRCESLQRSYQPMKLPLKDQIRKAARELESGIILRTLENHRWNRRRTAESLNISYRSLLYKMKACNLRGASTGEEVCE
jgi:transcriptional regulator with PAS, ATPase and Fis domain